MLCRVCGDDTAGFHYGVVCCAGCKAFFRRTIRYQVTYVCEGGGECPVSARLRNACRFCRFKKCVEIGMNANSLQCDRGRINRRQAEAAAKAQMRIPTVLPALTFRPERKSGERMSPCEEIKSLENCVIEVAAPDLETNDTRMMQVMASLVKLPVKDFVIQISANYKFIISLLVQWHRRIKNTTLENLWGENLARNSLELPSEFEKADIRAMARHMRAHLAAVFNESQKCVFFQLLSRQDQMSLMRWYAPQSIIISTIVSTVAAEGDFLVLGDDVYVIPRQEKRSSILNNIVDEILDDLVPRFRDLKPDAGEYSCLRLLALWNPEYISEPRGKEVARRIQQAVMATLEKHIESRNLQDETTVCHYGNLLMTLRQIQSAAQHLRQCIQLAKTMKLICMDQLFEELFTDPRPIEERTEVVMVAAAKAMQEETKLSTNVSTIELQQTPLADLNVSPRQHISVPVIVRHIQEPAYPRPLHHANLPLVL